MTTPAISIALCTWNGGRFLRAQLDSLMAQDFTDFEVVALDDGSTDDTVGILREYAARHPAFRVEVNAQQLGLNRNFEKALGLCRAPLIAPCDQDDLWEPRKLSTLATALGGASLAYCDSALVDAEGRSLGRRVSDRFDLYAGRDPRAFTFANCISGHAALFRRELLTRALPLPDGVYYDWWLAWCAAGADGIACVNEPLVRFRQHGGSASTFTHVQKKPRKPARERFENESRSLQALAARAPPAHAAFYAELWSLWQRREHGPVHPKLAAFLMRHARVLYALRKGPAALKWRHAFKHAFGAPPAEAA